MRNVYCDIDFKIYPHHEKLLKAVREGKRLITRTTFSPVPLNLLQEFFIKLASMEKFKNGKNDEKES